MAGAVAPELETAWAPRDTGAYDAAAWGQPRARTWVAKVMAQAAKMAVNGNAAAPSYAGIAAHAAAEAHAAALEYGKPLRVDVASLATASDTSRPVVLALGDASALANDIAGATRLTDLYITAQRAWIYAPLVAHALECANAAAVPFVSPLAPVHAGACVITGGVIRGDAWVGALRFALSYTRARSVIDPPPPPVDRRPVRRYGDTEDYLMDPADATPMAIDEDDDDHNEAPAADADADDSDSDNDGDDENAMVDDPAANGDPRISPARLHAALRRATDMIKRLVLQPRSMGADISLAHQRRLLLLVCGAQFIRGPDASARVRRYIARPIPVAAQDSVAGPMGVVDWRTRALATSTAGSTLKCFYARDGSTETAQEALARLTVPRRSERFAAVTDMAQVADAWHTAHQFMPIAARTAAALRFIGWVSGVVEAPIERPVVTVPEADLVPLRAHMVLPQARAATWTAGVRFLAACGIAYRAQYAIADSAARPNRGAPMVLLPRRVRVSGPGAASAQTRAPLWHTDVAAMVIHAVFALQDASAPLDRTAARAVSPLYDFVCFVFQRIVSNMHAVLFAVLARINMGENTSALALEEALPLATLALPWDIQRFVSIVEACCGSHLPAVNTDALEYHIATSLVALVEWADTLRLVSLPTPLGAYDASWWTLATRPDLVARARQAYDALRPDAPACAAFGSRVDHTKIPPGDEASIDRATAYWCALRLADEGQPRARDRAEGTVHAAAVLRAREIMTRAQNTALGTLFCRHLMTPQRVNAFDPREHDFRSHSLRNFLSLQELRCAWALHARGPPGPYVPPRNANPGKPPTPPAPPPPPPPPPRSPSPSTRSDDDGGDDDDDDDDKSGNGSNDNDGDDDDSGGAVNQAPAAAAAEAPAQRAKRSAPESEDERKGSEPPPPRPPPIVAQRRLVAVVRPSTEDEDDKAPEPAGDAPRDSDVALAAPAASAPAQATTLGAAAEGPVVTEPAVEDEEDKAPEPVEEPRVFGLGDPPGDVPRDSDVALAAGVENAPAPAAPDAAPQGPVVTELTSPRREPTPPPADEAADVPPPLIVPPVSPVSPLESDTAPSSSLAYSRDGDDGASPPPLIDPLLPPSGAPMSPIPDGSLPDLVSSAGDAKSVAAPIDSPQSPPLPPLSDTPLSSASPSPPPTLDDTVHEAKVDVVPASESLQVQRPDVVIDIRSPSPSPPSSPLPSSTEEQQKTDPRDDAKVADEEEKRKETEEKREEKEEEDADDVPPLLIMGAWDDNVRRGRWRRRIAMDRVRSQSEPRDPQRRRRPNPREGGEFDAGRNDPYAPFVDEQVSPHSEGGELPSSPEEAETRSDPGAGAGSPADDSPVDDREEGVPDGPQPGESARKTPASPDANPPELQPGGDPAGASPMPQEAATSGVAVPAAAAAAAVMPRSIWAKKLPAAGQQVAAAPREAKPLPEVAAPPRSGSSTGAPVSLWKRRASAAKGGASLVPVVAPPVEEPAAPVTPIMPDEKKPTAPRTPVAPPGVLPEPRAVVAGSAPGPPVPLAVATEQQTPPPPLSQQPPPPPEPEVAEAVPVEATTVQRRRIEMLRAMFAGLMVNNGFDPLSRATDVVNNYFWTATGEARESLRLSPHLPPPLVLVDDAQKMGKLMSEYKAPATFRFNLYSDMLQANRNAKRFDRSIVAGSRDGDLDRRTDAFANYIYGVAAVLIQHEDLVRTREYNEGAEFDQGRMLGHVFNPASGRYDIMPQPGVRYTVKRTRFPGLISAIDGTVLCRARVEIVPAEEQ